MTHISRLLQNTTEPNSIQTATYSLAKMLGWGVGGNRNVWKDCGKVTVVKTYAVGRWWVIIKELKTKRDFCEPFWPSGKALSW